MTQYRRKRATPRRRVQAARERPVSPDAAFLQLARDRFAQAAAAEEKQRQRELDDLRFYAGDQWPEDLITVRQGQAAVGNLPPMPARPTLVINKAIQPVAQMLNQERSMDMGAELIPADDFEGLIGPLDDTEVELREGLLRRIQRAPDTRDARTWAFERAGIAGRGFWGIMTRFAPMPITGAAPASAWDQEVYVERFYDQASVSVDPLHQQPDGSDMEWAFVGTYLTEDQYRSEFGQVNGKDNPLMSSLGNDEDFRALGEQCPGWFDFKTQKDSDGNTVTTKTRLFRVVNYYYTEYETRSLCLLKNGQTAWKDELPKGAEIDQSRDVIHKSVKWAKIDGYQKLDETDWPGPDIPIVKVLGRELQPYDDDRRVEGLVRPMRDSGQGLNYMISKGVEYLGLTPLPSWQMAAGQDEGFEQEYLLAATRTIPTLHYNIEDASGRPFPGPPTRTDIRVPVEQIWGAINLFGEFVKDTTLTPAAAMGDTDPPMQSGKAMTRVIDQYERGTSTFLDNQARSIRREGQIINGLLYPVYGIRPGRLARILNEHGDAESVLIDKPFLRQGGKPMPLAPMAPGQPMPDGGQHYRLTPDANFNVVVKVSKNYDTRRQQEATIVGALIAENPELMSIIGDLYFKNLDGPGHTEMAERVGVSLIPPVQQLLAAKKQGTAPPDPQVQQAQQQVQTLTAEVQRLQSGLAKEQLEAQTKIQIASMEIASKERSTDKEIASRERIAAMQAQTQLVVTQQKISQDAAEVSIEAETKRIAAVLDEKVGVEKQLSGQAHDASALGATHQQDLVSTILDHAHEHAMATDAAVQAHEQNQTPTPSDAQPT